MNTESSIMNILSNYDILDVISKLSALNLLPFNQNKAIVFDYIIDLALQSSREEGITIMTLRFREMRSARLFPKYFPSSSPKGSAPQRKK